MPVCSKERPGLYEGFQQSKKSFSPDSSKYDTGSNLMANLRIPQENAILLITERIDDIAAMMEKQPGPGYYDIVSWCSKTYAVIDEIFGSGDYRSEEIRLIGLPACSCNSPAATLMQMEIYHDRLMEYIDQIRNGMTPEEREKF
jgi:hypothetical protein